MRYRLEGQPSAQDRTSEFRVSWGQKEVVQGLIFEALRLISDNHGRSFDKKLKVSPGDYGYSDFSQNYIHLKLEASQSSLCITIPEIPGVKMKAWLMIHRGSRALKFVLKTQDQWGRRAPFLFATDFINQAINYYTQVAGPVEKVLTHWEAPQSSANPVTESRNYLEYLLSLPTLVNSQSRINAARQTWTARVLASQGFTEISDLVDFENTTNNGRLIRTITASFSRPVE